MQYVRASMPNGHNLSLFSGLNLPPSPPLQSIAIQLPVILIKISKDECVRGPRVRCDLRQPRQKGLCLAEI